MKKVFKETKVGKFLASEGFDNVLETVGNFVPGVAILDQVKDMVLGSSSKKVMTPENREKFLELLKLEQEELDSRLKDTANARDREVNMAKLGKTDWVQKAVIVSVLALFVTWCILIICLPHLISESSRELQITIRDLMVMVVMYYVGSSQGSKRKTEMMAQNPEK